MSITSGDSTIAASGTEAARIMSDLRGKVEAMGGGVDPGRPVVVIDLPIHNNIGDLMIMLGEIEYLRALGVKKVTYLSCHDDYMNNRWYKNEPLILFHGGGNFGDLYPEHDSLRSEILTKYKSLDSVIMPQSIHYDKWSLKNPIIKAINGHSKLTIHCRDIPSFEFAKDNFNSRIYLTPDMAHCLWPSLNETVQPIGGFVKTLQLMRRDVEASSFQAEANVGPSVDWDELFGLMRRTLPWRSIAISSKFPKPRGLHDFAMGQWIAHSQLMVGRAAQLFGGYSEIRTSRLHAHILACLLQRKSVLLDNSYGKLSRYFECWTRATGLGRLEPVIAK